MTDTAEDIEDLDQEAPEVSPLDMSDEDILNMPEPDEETASIEDTEDETEISDEAEVSDQDVSDQEKDLQAEDKTDGAADSPEKAADADGSGEGEVPDLNYQTEYERLLAPFRANGKDMQVGSVDDALALMKMGANYNKKMAGLKPNLKLMKMLGNNDLLDEEKLTYLIDLQKKDPEAVAKFIKDSGIDPLDIDTEKDTEYRPGTYTVDDKEIELDMVLEGIQDTKSFDETIEIISNKWDDSSRKVVLADPSIITVINEHVDNGIYGQINQIVENERMLGRLTELSDLEAYKHVGDVLQENGAFNQPGDTNAAREENHDSEQAPTKAKKSVDPKLKNRRRAAGSPKGTPSKKKGPAFDPLAMSDEDFEKAAASYTM